MEQVEKKWLSTDELIYYLGVKPDFVKKLRQAGEIPYSRIGRTLFYPIKEVDKLIRRNYVIKPR